MSNHQPLVTPNPEEFGLAVTVERAVAVNDPECLPAPGTLYKECNKKLFGKDYNLKWSTWVYTTTQGLDKEGNIVLLFAKNKTTTEANTPFKTISYMSNHAWPPILKGLRFYQDDSFRYNNGSKTAPRTYVRYKWVPGVNEGTRFTENHYTSPVPFSIPQHTVPVPTSVQWDWLGNSGSFPECLHDKIVLKPMATAKPVSGAIGDTGVLPGQVFEGTNFLGWSSYVISDRQSLEGPVWYRIQIRVTPPPEPEEDNR